MSDPLKFTKMSGAGNDFIVIDNRDYKLAEQGRREVFDAWCRRRIGIGADGVLLVEPAEGSEADFRMRYYNADGGEAESCGNGARCIGRFANLIGAAGDAMKFETKAGLYAAEMIGEEVRLTMSDPHSLRRNVALPLPDDAPLAAYRGKTIIVDSINTGVPHSVFFTGDLKGVPIVPLGRLTRYHAEFAPAGTNANFAQMVAKNKIAVRTYERGVEDETLACGTGSVAVALIAALKGFSTAPIEIVTSGGPILKIHFDRDGESFTNVRLEGEARVVYEGEVAFPSLGLAHG